MYLAAVAASILGMAGLLAAQDKNLAARSRSKSAAPEVAGIPAAGIGTNAVKKSKFPVIGYLQGRGQTIIIKAGAKGPIYSATAANGKVLFEDLTVEQLRAQAPEVHDFIKSAVAVNTRGPWPKIDASIRLPEH